MFIDPPGANSQRSWVIAARHAETILTPHPGEAATLLGVEAGEINADRLAAARRLAERSNSTVILKGAATIVADASGRALINPTGGPALGSGGTGDVLTGVVAGLWAQGLGAFDAAGLAAWWHGAAAEQCLPPGIRFGLLASELADALPETVRVVRAREAARFEEEGEPGGDLALRFP